MTKIKAPSWERCADVYEKRKKHLSFLTVERLDPVERLIYMQTTPDNRLSLREDLERVIKWCLDQPDMVRKFYEVSDD